jgi:hypothetical protein
VIEILSLGLLATMVCLALQVVASVLAVRYFARVAKRPPGPTPRWAIFLEFSILMFTLSATTPWHRDESLLLAPKDRLRAKGLL